MRELKTFVRLELSSLFGINKAIHTRDTKAKKRYIGLLAAWMLVIAMVAVYVALLSSGLSLLGLGSAVPAYLVLISSLLIILFSLFKAGGIIFSTKSYDIISSMPARTRYVVLSRFIGMYIEDLCFTLAVMLPGVLTLGLCEGYSLMFYLVSLVSSLLVPIIPLVLSTLLGTLVYAVTSRMKHKNMIQTVLMVALVIVVLLFSFSMQNVDEDSFNPEELGELAGKMTELIRSFYIPAVWLGEAMLGSNYLGLLWFTLLSLAALAMCVSLAITYYHSIVRALRVSVARHDYKLTALGAKGTLSALLLREAKRYFSSSAYVTNTIIGPIMGLIMSVAALVAGKEKIISSIPMPIPVINLLPIVLPAVICMMTTTSVSISMEGEGIDTIRTLPISAKMLFDSKIIFNLLLISPFYLVSELLLIITFKPSPLELLWLILVPALFIIFSLVAGISLNIRFHSFDWEREEQVVKQSASAFFGGFAGPLSCLVFLIVSLIAPPAFNTLVKALMSVIIAALSVALYILNNRTRLEEL